MLVVTGGGRRGVGEGAVPDARGRRRCEDIVIYYL